MKLFNTQNKVNLSIAGGALVLAVGISLAVNTFASATVKMHPGQLKIINGFSLKCNNAGTKLTIAGKTYKCTKSTPPNGGKGEAIVRGGG